MVAAAFVGVGFPLLEGLAEFVCLQCQDLGLPLAQPLLLGELRGLDLEH